MRKHFVSIALAAVAMLAALGAYIVNLRVSAERAEVEALKGSIARDLADIAALQAELRTRARLPQLEAWNRVALNLGAPGPQQLLGAPVQLAAYSPVQREAAALAAAQSAAALGAGPPATAAPVRPPIVIARADPAPAAQPTLMPRPVIAAAVTDTTLTRVAGALDNLGRTKLDSIAVRARADQSAAAQAALGPR